MMDDMLDVSEPGDRMLMNVLDRTEVECVVRRDRLGRWEIEFSWYGPMRARDVYGEFRGRMGYTYRQSAGPDGGNYFATRREIAKRAANEARRDCLHSRLKNPPSWMDFFLAAKHGIEDACA